MAFLTVILVLFIDRVLWRGAKARDYAWFAAYCRTASGTSAGNWLISSAWGGPLLLLPLVLLVAWSQGLFEGLGGGALELVFGAGVLLYAIGPRDLGHESDAFIHARDDGNDAEADELARRFDPAFEGDFGEPQRTLSVARGIVVQANHRLVAPLLWFVIFGPVGAAAYRLVRELYLQFDRDTCPEAALRNAEAMLHIADWAPSRVTAALYAAAGNFDGVGHAWKNFDYTPLEGKPRAEADQLLVATGLAALDTYPDMADSCEFLDELPPVVEDAMAMVWRALTLFVLLLAGGSLVGYLA